MKRFLELFSKAKKEKENNVPFEMKTTIKPKKANEHGKSHEYLRFLSDSISIDAC